MSFYQNGMPVQFVTGQDPARFPYVQVVTNADRARFPVVNVTTGDPTRARVVQAISGADAARYPQIQLNESFFIPLNDKGNGEVDLTPVAGTGSATFTRATTAWTRNSSGSWISVGSGVARSYYSPAGVYLGYLAEGQRTQFLGVTNSPATQTTASLSTGTYCLWVEGTGSATSSAGTATITGGGVATAGSPNVFTVTVSGTVTVTVSGSLSIFQLENGAFPSSYIQNLGAAGTSVTRNADILTYPSSGNVGASGGVVYCEANYFNATTANRPAISLYTDANNYAYLFSANTIGNYFWQVANGGVLQANINSTVVASVGATAKLAAEYGANDFAACVNGSTPQTDVSGTVPAFTTIGIGHATIFAEFGFCTVRNVRAWATQFSADQLRTITA